MNCTAIDKLRSYRVFGMAIFDWVATIIGMMILKSYFPELEIWNQSLWMISLQVTVIIILVHYFTATPTMLNYYLGISEKPVIKTC